MRTMHSILYAMSQFDMEAFVVGPPDMSLLDEFKAELDERNVQYREMESVESCIAEADVIYMEPVVQADYTVSRDEAVKDRPARPRRTGSPGSCSGRRPRATPSSCTRCRAWTSCPPTSTAPVTPATGSRPSTASSCGCRCSP